MRKRQQRFSMTPKLTRTTRELTQSHVACQAFAGSSESLSFDISQNALIAFLINKNSSASESPEIALGFKRAIDRLRRR